MQEFISGGYSVPVLKISIFIPVPYCLSYYSVMVWFETKKCDASIVDLLVIQSVLLFSTNFRIVFYFYEKSHWNFNRKCIESIDDFE